MTSLHVIFGLSPPQSKFLATPMIASALACFSATFLVIIYAPFSKILRTLLGLFKGGEASSLDNVRKIRKYVYLKYFFTKFQLSTSFLRYFISRLVVLSNSVAIRNLIFYNLGYAIYRLTIRPGLCGTIPVLRPCPGVPAGWWKCPVFFCSFVKATRKFAKTRGSLEWRPFFFLRSP